MTKKQIQVRLRVINELEYAQELIDREEVNKALFVVGTVRRALLNEASGGDAAMDIIAENHQAMIDALSGE